MSVGDIVVRTTGARRQSARSTRTSSTLTPRQDCLQPCAAPSTSSIATSPTCHRARSLRSMAPWISKPNEPCSPRTTPFSISSQADASPRTPTRISTSCMPAEGSLAAHRGHRDPLFGPWLAGTNLQTRYSAGRGQEDWCTRMRPHRPAPSIRHTSKSEALRGIYSGITDPTLPRRWPSTGGLAWMFSNLAII